jgi:hypothetical protein
VAGQQPEKHIVALPELPLRGGEACDAGALDVPRAVIDEQDARWRGSDAARGGGEEARIGCPPTYGSTAAYQPPGMV